MTRNTPSPATAPSGAVFALGALGLAVSATFSGIMAAQHIFGLTLPGCGAESACAAATNSVWGKLPVVGWPLSHVGAAWFLALLAAWVMSRGAFTGPIKWLARLSAVGSVVLIGAMISGGYVCPWCLGVHSGCLFFVVVMEVGTRGITTAVPGKAVGSAAALAIVTTAGLALAEAATKQRVEEEQEGQRGAAVEQIISKGDEDAAPDGEAFTGRYLYGPEEAAIRIVIISDYQCPDCKKIEMQLRQVLEERDDVSVSAKHFPFCTMCNKNVPRNLHPNACWAARAAEIAGQLGGDEAFWKMHFWLFDKEGKFETAAELREGIAAAGLADQAQEFMSRMTPDSVKEIDTLIKADIEEAVALGLHFTPMVFINGVELKGVFARDALLRTVEEVAATNPTPRTAAADRPPMAIGKYVDDWQQGDIRLLEDASDWVLGDRDAPVRLVMWSDYTSEHTATAFGYVEELMKSRPYLSFRFRHYPLDEDCNMRFKDKTVLENGCEVSRLIEAAGQLGGEAKYWEAHKWILQNRPLVGSPGLLPAAASALGLDVDQLVARAASEEVASAIQEDVRAAYRIPARGFPAFVLNDRFIPRWQLDGESVMDVLVNAAYEEAK